MKKIALLGGIGPEATSVFYSKLIKRIQESNNIKSNSDFPNILINSIPANELIYEKTSRTDLSQYIQGIKDLKKFKPDFIAMVCNTIHLFLDEIKIKSNFDAIISLPDEVKLVLTKKHRNKKICVLGTELTVTRGLYNFDQIKYINLTSKELKIISDIIFAFNIGKDINLQRQRLAKIISNKKMEGAELFLAACTEISELIWEIKDIQYEDTFYILLNAVLKKLGN
jgi:aspartate racemase